MADRQQPDDDDIKGGPSAADGSAQGPHTKRTARIRHRRELEPLTSQGDALDPRDPSAAGAGIWRPDLEPVSLSDVQAKADGSTADAGVDQTEALAGTSPTRGHLTLVAGNADETASAAVRPLDTDVSAALDRARLSQARNAAPGVPERERSPAGRSGRASRGPVAASDASNASGATASRHVPTAIAVGLVLGAAAIASLLMRPSLFVVFGTILGAWAAAELALACVKGQLIAPLVPILIGAIGVPLAAYYAGGQGLTTAFFVTVIAVMLWVALDASGSAIRDAGAGVFIVAYVPLLIGFVFLILAGPQGAMRTLTYLAVATASDTGGYVVGSLLGRHRIAPRISPGKTWEGFAGSLLVSVGVALVAVPRLIDGSYVTALLLGVCVALAATVGDLAESLLKRDVGIKDMGSIIPGHGGVMERLDSLVVAAPVAFAVFAVMM